MDSPTESPDVAPRKIPKRIAHSKYNKFATGFYLFQEKWKISNNQGEEKKGK